MDKKDKKFWRDLFIEEATNDMFGLQEIKIQEHTTDKTYWDRVAKYFKKKKK